jgi:hypothetical protein
LLWGFTLEPAAPLLDLRSKRVYSWHRHDMLRGGRNDQRYSRLEKQTPKYVTQQVISVTMTPHVDIFVLSA